jgi:hypothetical protein
VWAATPSMPAFRILTINSNINHYTCSDTCSVFCSTLSLSLELSLLRSSLGQNSLKVLDYLLAFGYNYGFVGTTLCCM